MSASATRPYVSAAARQSLRAELLLSIALVLFGGWYIAFLVKGPSLAINHDELNFIHEGLRLPVQHHVQNYARAPLLYEVIAVVEIGWYIALRLLGDVASSSEYLVNVIANIGAHLAVYRALVGISGLALLVQVYRLGQLFGGKWAGALASLLCATNLTFIALVSVCKEEPIFWTLLITACLQAWRAAEDPKPRHAVLAGVAIGASFCAKLLGFFAIVLCAVPLLRALRTGRKQAIKIGILMALSAGVTVLLLFPFLVTDSHRVFESINHMRAEFAGLTGRDTLALWPYLSAHLPNLTGWIILVAGLGELVFRSVREPRGPVLLTIVPITILLFLGLRPGHSMAYYIFPVAMFLCTSAASLATRFAQVSGLAHAPLVAIGAVMVVIVSDGAFLRGSVKHMLILTAPDTRLVARDFVVRNAQPGDDILVTNTIVGYNFWGPPLISFDDAGGTGPFAVANRQALDRSGEPRYRLHYIDGPLKVPSESYQNCKWIVMPEFAHPTIELGPGPEQDKPPVEFQPVAAINAFPDHAYLFPYYTSVDYETLRSTSLVDLWRKRAMGWTVIIYQKIDS